MIVGVQTHVLEATHGPTLLSPAAARPSVVCELSVFVISSLRLARLGVSGVFFMHGVAVGSWLSRIPAVQEHLALGEAALGLALLGSGLGALLAMLPAGALIARYGSRAIVVATAVPTCLALCLIALASSGPMLFGALVLWGASGASLDVSMNAQGASIEQQRGRPILSSLHGLWSVGAMAGGGTSALLAALEVSLQTQFLVEAPLLLLAIVAASRAMLSGGRGHRGLALARPHRALLALAVVTFCAVTAEGSMFDWSGVFLHRVLSAPDATAASGAVFLSAAMAVGRLVGDFFTFRFGAPTLARACAALGAAGMLTVILAPSPPVVFAGLVALGFGLSIVVPLAFGAAGRATGMAPGAAIAAVATVGYFGFLAAPPTIGFVAERVGLRGAFGLLLVLLLLIAVLAPATVERPTSGHSVGGGLTPPHPGPAR
jgi:fucose permease